MLAQHISLDLHEILWKSQQKSLLLNIVFMCVHWSVLTKGIILSSPRILSHFILQNSNEIDRIISPFYS